LRHRPADACRPFGRQAAGDLTGTTDSSVEYRVQVKSVWVFQDKTAAGML